MRIDLPGFADPVADSQSAFRAVLDAMSRPGTIRAAGAGLTVPAPLSPAAAALLLTLADADTKLHLAPAFADAADWLRFHTGAPLTSELAQAAFILTDTLPDLAAPSTGTDEQPQDGATILLQLPSLTTGAVIRISGPGLQTEATITPSGLPTDFPERWAANHALFPRGIDLILCAGGTLMALPRSLKLER